MGCVRQRGNRFVVDYRDNEKRRHMEFFKTDVEAYARWDKVQKQLKRDTYVAPLEMPTLEEFAATWLATKRGRRIGTFAQYQSHIDLHIVPEIGSVKINELTVRHFEALKRERLGKLKPQTVNKVLTTATAILTYAMSLELIERNPAELVGRCHMGGEELPKESRPRLANDVGWD